MSTGAFSKLAFSPLAFNVDTGPDPTGSAAGFATVNAVGGSIATAEGSASGSSSASASPAAGFEPSDIADLILWIDVSDTSTLTLSGNVASQIVDKSANALAFTQPTAANRPTYSATSFPGGKPALLFSSIGRLQAFKLPFASNQIVDYTAFLVVSPTSATASFSPFLGFGGGTDLEFASWQGTPDVYFHATDFRFQTPLAVSTPYYIEADRDAATGLMTGSVNGISDLHATGITGALPITTLQSNIGNGSQSGFLIAALFVYARKLTAGEKSQLYSYINDNWVPAPPSSVGTAAGISSASAVGNAIATATGSANGTSTVSGQGQAISTATGSADGSSSAGGIGRSTAQSIGTAVGASDARGENGTFAVATGSAEGSSGASAVGGAIATSSGLADGTSTAQATGHAITTGAGQAAGASDVDAVGSSVATGTGSASGSSSDVGEGRSTATATGQASASSAAHGSGNAIVPATGQAEGNSAALGHGGSISAATGHAAGSSSASGTASPITSSAGSASGHSEASASGVALAIGVGTAAGTSTAQATGKALRVATDRMTRQGSGRIRTVSGTGRRRDA